VWITALRFVQNIENSLDHGGFDLVGIKQCQTFECKDELGSIEVADTNICEG